ncbi:MAG TPA: carbohydrate ABC transporter permease [Ruminiclostridium sp.]
MKNNRKDSIIKILMRIILIVSSIIFVFPFLWSIYSSFKTSREFLENPWMFPGQLYIQNYYNAFIEAHMGNYFLNSIVITIISVIVCLLISYSTAYTITRFNNVYTRLLKKTYMSAFMLPAILGLIPLFLLMHKLGLYDSRLGLILIDITVILPFSVFVLTGFMAGISRDYEEAAVMDGCSRYGIMFKIVLPLAMPSIVTISIFNFMGIWNEYIYGATMITTDAKRTLPVGLVNLMARQQYHTDWGALFAGMVIIMIPSITIYLLMQEKITSGIASGGIKM